jgi:hypothetical protein
VTIVDFRNGSKVNGVWYRPRRHAARIGHRTGAFKVTSDAGLEAVPGADGLDTAGLDTDDTTRPCATAAVLLELITGVSITGEVLEEGEFTSGAVPFPYW